MLKSSSALFGKREEPKPTPPILNQASQTNAASAQRMAAAGTTTATQAAGTTPTPQPNKTADIKPDGSAGNRLIVGPDVRLKGAEIHDCDTLVVEGHVEATMDSRIIRIAEKGEFTGKVGIDIAEIHGTFTGELNARDQLIIHSTGKVSGKIRYGKVLIEEGGELCGDIQSFSSHPATTNNTPAVRVPDAEVASLTHPRTVNA